MKINKIVMKNFRQYKDITINLLPSKNYNLHSIIGQNGIGKSNLLNAINWCLYETEPHLGSKNGTLPICNINSMIQNNKTIVSVLMEVIDEEGVKTIFERSKEYIGSVDKYIEKPSVFDIFRRLDRKNILDKITEKETKDLIINKLFPESISSYFFFDGEKLDKYFKHDHIELIKSNILKITNLQNLVSIKSNLEEIFNEKRKESSGRNIESEVIHTSIETLRKELEDKKQLYFDVKNDRRKAKERLLEINETLRGIEDIKSLEENREKYSKLLVEKESQISDVKKNIFNFIREYTILIKLFPKIEFMLSKINEKELIGQLPPQIDKSILNKSILNKKCSLCKNDLDDNSLKELLTLLNKLDYSNKTSHILSEFRPILRKSIRDLKEYTQKKENYLKELKIKEDDKNKISLELEKIKEVLLNTNNKESIIKLQIERSELEDSEEITLKREINLEQQIKKLEDEIDLKNKQLNKILEQEENNRILLDEQNFITDSIQIINHSYDELLDSVREDIRLETQNIFFDLIWKKDVFNRIELDDRFTIKLYNNYNLECLGSCSAAERALLALSFTLALHKISGFETPLVIDTPIARVSDKNRENFAEVLKKVSLKKQIIFLFTPSEYSDEISLIFESITATKINLYSKGNYETFINKGEE